MRDGASRCFAGFPDGKEKSILHSRFFGLNERGEVDEGNCTLDYGVSSRDLYCS